MTRPGVPIFLWAFLFSGVGVSGQETRDPPPRVSHYALIVSGTSYSDQQAGWYWNSSSWMYRVLRDKFKYDGENIYYLYEDPARDAKVLREKDKALQGIIDGKATRANVEKVLAHLSEIMRKGDRLFLYMVGHTGARRGHSYYDTVGPKLSDTALAGHLDRLDQVEITLVMSPCATEGFIWQCSGKGRVIVVSTRIHEGNSAGVAEAFIRGIKSPGWDGNRDGKNSILEAYGSVTEEQERWWRKAGRAQAEHALLDDNGDGKGHHLPEADGGDGKLAAKRFLGEGGAPLRLSPRAISTLAKRNREMKLER